MCTSRLFGAVFIWIIIVFCPLTKAATILDTASGTFENGGLILGNNNWLLHRFEITSTTTITSIGGFISNGTGSDKTIFAAIVQLTGSTDLPDSIDLTSSDVLSTTLINIGTTSNLYQTSINYTLAPGWYALELGTNSFGASSVPSSLYMNNFANDLAPSQNVYVAYQAGHPTLANTFGTQLNKSRFVIEGNAVPLPAAVWLFGSGMLGLIGIARRKKAA